MEREILPRERFGRDALLTRLEGQYLRGQETEGRAAPTRHAGPIAVSTGWHGPLIAVAVMPDKTTCRLKKYQGRGSPV